MNPEELRRQLENGSITEAEYLDRMSSLQSGYPQDMFMSTGQRSDFPTGYEGQPGYQGEIQTPLGRTYIPNETFSRGRPSNRGQIPQNPSGEVDSRGRIITDGYNEYQPRFVDRMRDNWNERRFGAEPSIPNTGQYDSQEDYIEQMQEAQAGSPDAKSYEQLAQEYDQMGQTQGRGQATGQGASMGPRYLNPWGGDMNTNAHLLGRAIGSEPGSRGRGLGIASGIGNLGLGLARTIGSGIGYANRYDETMDTYRRNRTMDRTYTNQPSYYDTNMTGGQMGKYGGEKKYEYGGKADSTPIDRYQRIMNSRSYMKKGGKKMYQNGGGPDDPPEKRIGQDPYADLGIGPDDKLHGKFIKVRDAGYVNPDGTILEEPQVVDINRLEGMKDRLRSLLPNQERTPMQRRITYTYQRGGEVGSQDLMQTELDMLMQLKNVDAPNFTPEDGNRLSQLDTNLKRIMQEGGEVQQEQAPQEGQPEIDPELLQIAQEMAQEFSSAEEAQAYLEQEGVPPEVVEQVIELFIMVQQEQGQQQERQPAASGVMRNTVAGDMSMEFRYGGRKKYPKL